MESKKIKIGDLVRFVREPATLPRTIPSNQSPIGIVVSLKRFVTSGPPESQAFVGIVEVLWSDSAWNGPSGISEENEFDLQIIQKGIGNPL